MSATIEFGILMLEPRLIPAQRIKAPANGYGVSIGYENLIVDSPDGQAATEWEYFYQPPFADGLFKARFRGQVLPDYFWGRNHFWSTDSNYFTLEQHSKRKRWFVYVVRVVDGKWFRVAEDSYAGPIAYPIVKLGYCGTEKGSHAEFTFTGKEQWVSPI